MLSSTLNDLQTQKSSKEKNVIVFFIEKGFLKESILKHFLEALLWCPSRYRHVLRRISRDI